MGRKKLSEEERREKNRERKRKYYLEHKEAVLQKAKERRAADPEKYRKRGRDCYRRRCLKAIMEERDG